MEQLQVDVVERGLVSPATATPNNVIWLSNLDLVQVGNTTPAVMVYRKGRDVDVADFFAVDKIKSALSAALVQFYPFAGRIAVGVGGRHEIRCTGEGVYYVVARCASTLDEFDFTPSPKLRELLVPSTKTGQPRGAVFMFQLTFFKCGGVCLGTFIEHCAVDGLSTFFFIKTWANIARGDVNSEVKVCYDRTVLRARSPPFVTYHHLEYQMTKRRTCQAERAALAVAKLKISKDNLESLKNKGRRGGTIDGYVTSFEAVMAHVWRCACKARQLEGHERTRVYMAADIRNRLSSPLPAGYFGNAVVKTSATATVDDILSSTRFAAERLREASARVDEEYIRSVVDYLELVEKDTGGLSLVSVEIPETDLWVVSWLKLPLYEADFGWGKVSLFGRAQTAMNGLIYIMQNPEDAGDGGISVVVTLETTNMARFKKIFHLELEA